MPRLFSKPMSRSPACLLSCPCAPVRDLTSVRLRCRLACALASPPNCCRSTCSLGPPRYEVHRAGVGAEPLSFPWQMIDQGSLLLACRSEIKGGAGGWFRLANNKDELKLELVHLQHMLNLRLSPYPPLFDLSPTHLRPPSVSTRRETSSRTETGAASASRGAQAPPWASWLKSPTHWTAPPVATV